MNSLNPKVFDEDVEQVAIRTGFGEGFLLAGKDNPNVVGLCADLIESTKMNLFKEAFPERFIEVGVAEQNLASVASGMAAMGKIPFISSYAMFSPGRNWEQIRTTICYNNVNVKIAGSHAGVSVGPDGGTHQALEDIAITRVLPRMIVISPCDAIEAKKATLAASMVVGPTYIRLAREKTPVITTEETPFEIGKARIFYQGKKTATVGIIATGALVHKALLAARQLEDDGISVRVLNLSTIKPLDENAIISVARETRAIVTVEEHQTIGGMGSAVAEFLARTYPVRMGFIGVDDQFGQSGKPDELIAYYGMGVESIVAKVREICQRK
ncbi:MAG: transketolase family protein [Bryobacteraceae bacterium]